MAVYSPVSKEQLEIFLLQYNIGSLTKFEGILEGIENTNYKIVTSNNEYILTIFEKRVNSDELPFFINLKKHLSKKNFECPKPIKNKKGKYINLLNNKNCIIISFLKGKKTVEVANDHCNQVGKMLALFHQESKDFLEKRNNNMSYNQWKSIFLKCQNTKNNKYSVIMSYINKELSYLEKEWPKNLPEGIIHADVFQDNVFFLNNKFSGLIDFYFSCNDFFAYDLAITINAWCFNINNKFEKDKFINLIQGYEKLRSLNKIEKKYLSTLLRGAATRILLTRVHDYIFHEDDAYVTPKDPAEYLSILKFHQVNDLGELL
jgi:homoserine kinase type II